MSPARILANKFLTLSYVVRVNIAHGLGLCEPFEYVLQDQELNMLIFKRAKKKKLIEKFWIEVELASGVENPINNPFIGR